MTISGMVLDKDHTSVLEVIKIYKQLITNGEVVPH